MTGFTISSKLIYELVTYKNDTGKTLTSAIEQKMALGTRQSIHAKIWRDRFLSKGGAHFNSINGTDLECLFMLYDTALSGFLLTLLRQSSTSLTFVASPRVEGPAILLKEDITNELQKEISEKTNGINLIFELSPNVLTALLNEKHMPGNTRLDALLEAFEIALIALITIWVIPSNDIHNADFLPNIWGKVNPLTYPKFTDAITWSSRGILYVNHFRQKVFGRMTEWQGEFEDVLMFHSKIYETTIGNMKREKTQAMFAIPSTTVSTDKHIRGFVNVANSCYLDALLMIFLDGKDSYWRDIFFQSDHMGTAPARDVLACQIVSALRSSYDKIVKENSATTCTEIRTLLANRMSSLRSGIGNWSMFNVAAIFDLLTELFPEFQMTIPEQIFRWDARTNSYIAGPCSNLNASVLTVWDFMDPLTNIEAEHDYKAILWDRVSTPMLVFYHGGTPRITRFDSLEPEPIITYARGQRQIVQINKARTFGETILNGRYELIGGIMLNGVSRGVSTGDTGSHYTSFYRAHCDMENKNFEGRNPNGWILYDDMRPVLTYTETCPKVFQETQFHMPTMYFYRKVAEPQNVEMETDEPNVYTGDRITYRKCSRYLNGTKTIIFLVSDIKPENSLFPVLISKLGSPFITYPLGTQGTQGTPSFWGWQIPEIQSQEFEERLKSLDR